MDNDRLRKWLVAKLAEPRDPYLYMGGDGYEALTALRALLDAPPAPMRRGGKCWRF